MPWVRFDDQFPIHRKVDTLSDAAFRLHVSAICWCNRNLTDGVVATHADLESAAPRTMRRPARYAAELCDRGLWHESNPHGWVINDYLEWQEGKDVIERNRKANAERQRRYRERRRHNDEP